MTSTFQALPPISAARRALIDDLLATHFLESVSATLDDGATLDAAMMSARSEVEARMSAAIATAHCELGAAMGSCDQESDGGPRDLNPADWPINK